MRVRLAAATGAVIVLIGILGAPALPVMIGATGAYAWLVWRAVAIRGRMTRIRRRAHPNRTARYGAV